MSEILQFIPGNGILHQMNPVIKLILIITIVGLSVITSSVAFLCLLTVIVLAGYIISRLQKEIIAQIPFLAILAVFLLALSTLTIQSGDVLYYLISPGTLIPSGIAITDAGLTLGIIFAIRFIVMIAGFQLFIITTKPGDLVTGLLVFRMPVDYILMLLIALRFIPGLQLEAKRIHEAQISRGFNPGEGLMGKVRSMKPIIVPLVANSLAKTQVIGLTLDMRGYRLKKSLHLHDLTYNKADYAGLLIAMMMIVIFIFPLIIRYI